MCIVQAPADPPNLAIAKVTTPKLIGSTFSSAASASAQSCCACVVEPISVGVPQAAGSELAAHFETASAYAASLVAPVPVTSWVFLRSHLVYISAVVPGCVVPTVVAAFATPGVFISPAKTVAFAARTDLESELFRNERRLVAAGCWLLVADLRS